MKNLLFLTLRTFSATGGIEKVCRIMGKALYEQSVEESGKLEICSMYDRNDDATGNVYFPTEFFTGYGVNKMSFTTSAVKKGIKSDIVILSHINLLMIAWLIKKMSPQTKIILMAHGIEIWGEISKSKSTMLGAVNCFWAVSNYTKKRIIESHGIAAEKVMVLNNCLDPFLPAVKNIKTPETLYGRYGIRPGDKILFTLTRLSGKEKYKGYDQVIDALLQIRNPHIKYILAGKADATELERMKKKLDDSGLNKQVILAGFIPDEELAAHFKMSDCYIMPSSKEGFGIVFIEAMYYGVPVIGGNSDGTMDALKDGALGLAVTPGNVSEIGNAVTKILFSTEDYLPDGKLLMENFSYIRYKYQLQKLL